MTLETVSENKIFGGRQLVVSHQSNACHCTMKFAVYVPPEEIHKGPRPVLYWLSGLTCTEQNFITKSGYQKIAAELGLIVVAPDTSPRGPDLDGNEVPDDAEGAYDFGLGAGFYVNATEDPWSRHYNMYAYVTEELVSAVGSAFPVDASRSGILGHSMGGHGALTLHLKNPEIFKTCSAFSPIVAPSQVPWGQKAFSNYLGADERKWAAHDATSLAVSQPSNAELLIDQGSSDDFLEGQLKPELFAAACQRSGQKLNLRMQDGYDHSFYFIATFIEDHLRWHAERLA